MHIIPKNPYTEAGRNINSLLTAHQKKEGGLMLVLLVINAFMDVLGLAAILPLISVMLRPALIQENQILHSIYLQLGIERESHFLIFLSVCLLLVFLVKNAFSLWVNYREGRFSFQVAYNMCERQFKHYYKEGWLYINQDTSGRIIYNVINIPFYFANSYIMPFLMVTTELVVIVFIFLGIFLYNPALMLVLAATLLPAIALLYRSIKNKAKKLGEEKNELFPVSFNYVSQAMKGFVDVKLANKEQYFLANYLRVQDRINRINIVSSVLGRIPAKGGEIFIALGVVIIFLFSFLFSEKEGEILFILGLFAGAAYRVMPSINRVVTQLVTLKTYGFTVTELNKLKKFEPYDFTTTERLPLAEKIELDNISYTYPDAKVSALEGISFEIRKGETIGLVGESGSGKTTLLNVLLRLITESSGEIRVDGVPIGDDNRSAFQKNLGYVKQDVFISDASIKENIAFGEDLSPSDKGTEEAIAKILDKLRMSDFLDTLDEGLDFQLGEVGNKLSGGQKQRIGIARALYKYAEILVFDEATSALDPETEKAITETIQDLAQMNKTVIIVAHRITTLRGCDRIYELKQGKINRVCSYETLIKENIDYATSPSQT